MTPPNQTSPVAPPPPPMAGQSSSGKAVAALILGILSLVCFGFLAGIPAIILGRMELKAIDQGLSPESNRTLAKVGYILGIVGTILTCLGLLAYIAIIVIAVISSGAVPSNTF